LAKLANSIDRVMDHCNMNTRLQADRVAYKQFVATGVKANVLLTNNNWKFSNVSLRHADGSLNLDGSLEGMQSNIHRLNMNASLQSINISKLFQSFNNFGLDDLESKNIRGLLTTNIQLTGILDNEATLDPSSLNGVIDLSLLQGQLIDFEPLQKMSLFLLKKRDFSNLEFAELKNRFELNGRFLVINRMEVQSTALSMYVEGLYDLRGDSTDLVIQVPLSNLKKRKPDYVPENKGLDAKTGMSVYVRARSGKGDDIDFKIGLFKKKSALAKKRESENKP
ncbi:MAG TPA: AsmA-like C-terminal region-containing protein, partial [Chitinophagaceae bacterium]|nr:AsmA-like C-terminal region-containing protein [Chitinophagaceae bacterium]